MRVRPLSIYSEGFYYEITTSKGVYHAIGKKEALVIIEEERQPGETVEFSDLADHIRDYMDLKKRVRKNGK